jgi:Tfp pilus assembly protein PilF
MSNLSKIILTICFIILLLHIWAAIFPSHYNWGFHFFAFHDIYFSLLLLAVALSLFIPKVQLFALNKLESPVKQSNNKFPRWFHFTIVCAVLLLVSLMFPAKLHLLGDGTLLLREVSGIKLGDELPPAFNRQLLAGMIIKTIKNIFETGKIENAETIFRIIDLLSGILMIAIIFWLLGKFKLSTIEKFFYSALIFFTAGSQFFLGYVENYALLFVAMAAYLTSGWLTLEHKVNLFIPVAFFLIMVGLHLGSVILFPTIMFILYHGWKFARAQTLSILLLSSVVFTGILIFYLPQFETIIKRTISESRWNFLPIFTSDNFFSYPIFSYPHIIDWLNANLLISPFVVVMSIIFISYLRKEIDRKAPAFLFVVTAAVLGLIFTFVTFFALGMARDWDFMATFFLPVIFLNVYLLIKYFSLLKIKRALLVVVGLTILHWVGWVCMNADATKNYSRVVLLNDSLLLGHVPRINFYETLGSYNWAKNNYSEALLFFEKYMDTDSSNPRILGNLSAIYTKLGDKENTFRILKRAAEANSQNPAIYINLGVAYSQRGDTSAAMLMYKNALKLDSTRAKAYANLGSLLMKQKNYSEAAFNFSKAVQFGLYDSLLLREAGNANFMAGNFSKSLLYFTEYLKVVPNDTRVQFIAEKLKETIKDSAKK